MNLQDISKLHVDSRLIRERDNAGLNVTSARHVFLLEPVVNHSFEVQGSTSTLLLDSLHFC